ncbi:TetR family transcriptional regulator [Bhargavaea cecembensis]|uniref:TetR family transcriptional regulator n=1 Tax=Bhargavaea cecembensis TaxID=394098 RepID=A0A161RA76_9BACL|nr:TetR/AcrR family transcriptional regulator [Bhargavaea cecembensis]KZE40285.1 TetR family transcriptional regulator [Bhargavaea cecembensis]
MKLNDPEIDNLFGADGSLTERQKKILQSAIECFADQGYAGTSTKEIATRAGVAEGTIFRHYRTKKDLLMTIVKPVMIRFMAPFIINDLNKVLDRDFDQFEDFLRAMIENRKDFIRNNLKLIRILLQEIPFHPELKDQFVEHVGKNIFERMIQIISHYQNKGQIIDMEPKTVLRLTLSSIGSYFLARYTIFPEADWEDEKEIEETIRFLIRGLSPN